ncbi:unnamed protein product [Prorocentrum cordatum]|nr:unnamed protein product [Polarella glacialis]
MQHPPAIDEDEADPSAGLKMMRRSSTELPGAAKELLGVRMSRRSTLDLGGDFTEKAPEEQHEHDDPDAHGEHGHAEKPQSILTAGASAVINFLLMFGLCCAYGMILFEDEWNARHRGLGVKINLATALVAGLILASFSKVPVAIGGPDLNPVVFLGMLAQTIAKEVATKHGFGDAYPGGSSTCPGEKPLTFCEGGVFTSSAPVAPDDLAGFADAAEYAEACDLYHEELRATVIFTVSATSAGLGLVFFVLGKFRLTRFLSYIPIHIMEAFLACIGYKVFKYSLEFCKYEPTQFVPAACVGVPLYFVKALHIGNPAVVIPLMLLIPLGIFYAIVFGPMQEDLHGMRKENWMFEELVNAEFWSPWENGLYMSWGKIDFKAFAAALGDLPVMIIVCGLDCALKLFNTDTKLPVKTDKDYEVKLYAATNVLTTMGGFSVGYMQLKFNVINFGVMGNASDRRGGMMYALLCGLCFFGSTDPFNYLPRFFLSTLLFFAGAGFIAENLWGSRKFLSAMEWFQVLLIIACFIVSSSLLVAVVVGGIMAACKFVADISKVPTLIGEELLMGDKIISHIRRPPADSLCVRHLSQHFLLVARLKGFLFFGSAQSLGDAVIACINERAGSPQAIRFIAMDFTMVDGLDASAAKCLGRVTKAAQEKGVRILWCGAKISIVSRLNASGTITSHKHLFDDLGFALAFVENKFIAHITTCQRLWLNLHPGFAVFRGLLAQQAEFEPFQDILTSDASRWGCPWGFCNRVSFKKHETILWSPGKCDDLFLIHSGAVGLFTSIPEEVGGSWGDLVVTYERGSLLNREAIGLQESNDYFAIALEDGEALSWNQAQLRLLQEKQPAIATALQRAVLLQEAQDARHQGMGPHAIPMSVKGRSVAGSAGERRLPGSLRRLRAGIATARWLGRLGLFVADESRLEDTLCPPLPQAAVEVLRTAFFTFSEGGSLSATKAAAALRYAGIHDCVLRDDADRSLSEAEFMELGHEAAMMRLDASQEATLQNLFTQLASSNGEFTAIPLRKLIELFEARTGQSESLEVVVGVASVWMPDGRSEINAESFVHIMSRITMLHMRYWRILTSFEEVVKAGAPAGSEDADTITAHMLVATNRTSVEGRDPGSDPGSLSHHVGNRVSWNRQVSPIGEEKAAEMIEAASFLREVGSDQSVDVFDVASLLSIFLAPHPRPLPPKPKTVDSSAAWKKPPLQNSMSRCKSEMAMGMSRDWTELHLDSSIVGGGYGEVNLASVASSRSSLSYSSTDHDLMTRVPEELDAVSCAGYLHAFLENPESSRCAAVFSLVMALLIMVSVLTLVMEPLISPGPDISQSEQDVWFAVDGFFSVAFTVEFVLRFAVTNASGRQTHADFLKAPLNLADLVAVLPWYVEVATRGNAAAAHFRLLRVARLMRLARVVRLGRLARRSAVIAPIAVILVVIWGIFLKNGLSSTC